MPGNTFRSLLFVLFLVCSGIAQADILVLAAASLTNAINDIAKAYEISKGVKIKSSFASSSVLAKQVENGIPADLFISADLKWMDYLYDKGKIDGNSRREFLGNTLVLVAPKDKGFAAKLEQGFNLAGAFEGMLCTGETETVPVGKYAKEALQKLAMWDALKARIVGAEDVRSALAFVERGECAAGIVYGTDARVSNKVTLIGVFPENSHAPIVYPMALVSQSDEAKAFLDYLTQPEAAAVFDKYGFKRITSRTKTGQ